MDKGKGRLSLGTKSCNGNKSRKQRREAKGKAKGRDGEGTKGKQEEAWVPKLAMETNQENTG